MTGLELRRRLDEAGYDLDAIDQVGNELHIDLTEVLAAWTPTILQITQGDKLSWWRRFLKWRRAR
jgi:hypothetical protein